jgi:hypothetical protein
MRPALTLTDVLLAPPAALQAADARHSLQAGRRPRQGR